MSGWSRWSRPLLRFFDLFYPRYCYACQEVIRDDNQYLCLACWKKLSLIRGGICLGCGMCLGRHIPCQPQCPWCQSQRFSFDAVRAGGKYEATLRQLLIHFKYHGILQLQTPLARLIAWQIQQCPWDMPAQAIVAVPMSPESQRKRGYNQSELLASRLARYLQIPHYPGALRKNKTTLPQAGLDRAARKHNLHGAFELNDDWHRQKLSGQTVLLVDDVFTTGSTAHECAKTLKKEAQTGKVYVAVVCRAV